MVSKSRTQQSSRRPKTRSPGGDDTFRSFAIYGPSGTGKTTLAGTFPTPILLLDLNDKGDDSVSDVKGLRVFDVETEDDLEEIYWDIHKHPDESATVVMDTVTQLQQILILDLMAKKGKLGKGKRAGDWGTMTKQDWGTVSGKMKDWITKFRDLPVNMVFLAQHRVFNVEEEDNADGMIAPEVGPSLSPATNRHLCAAVHVIANTFIQEKITRKKNEKGKVEEKSRINYCLGIGPNAYYTRKVRKPKGIELPGVIVDPTYDDLLEIIQGE